ncbi:MAG: DUF177 domain-containing protein [Clostridia bacterium]|nr:DUF177 domain-containing protein [Clostridia bacterium]
MFIELEPIFNNEGAEKSFSYEFSLEDGEIVKSIKAKGSVFNRTGIVSLEAQTEFLLDTACDRCASPVVRSMKVPVSHILVYQLNDEDNDDFYLVEDMHFNLDELIREDVLLSLPSKILCREDCKGVCPFCGANLNETDCGCKAPADPRLEALKQFLE